MREGNIMRYRVWNEWISIFLKGFVNTPSVKKYKPYSDHSQRAQRQFWEPGFKIHCVLEISILVKKMLLAFILKRDGSSITILHFL